MNRKDKKKIPGQRRRLLLFVGTAILLGLLLVAAMERIFDQYRDGLLDSQSSQLTNITESVSNNIKVYLTEIQEEAKSLVRFSQFLNAEENALADTDDTEAMEVFLEEIIGSRDDIAGVQYFSPDSRVRLRKGRQDLKYVMIQCLGGDETFERVDVIRDEEGTLYMGVAAQSEAGSYLRLLIPMKTVYEKTASYIQMGDKGYVMVKDSNGIILMHPSEDQIGIDVLKDRKRMYPDFDYSDLEELVAHQLAGETGVEIYDSYWWTDENPQKVVKVSSYMPVWIGDDFLIVSAVINYSEITEPIQNASLRMMAVLLLLLALFAGALFVLWRLISGHTRLVLENKELRLRSARAEERRKEEEALAQRQRLQLIGAMTGGIAHEFNNLLTPILGYSAMILAGMSEEDENYDDMKEIQDAAEKASEIIGQITRFSAKNGEKMLSRIHMGEAVKKALVLTEATKPRNVTLLSRIGTEHDVCLANPVQITQMITNLSHNALQAIGSAPGELTIEGGAVRPADEEGGPAGKEAEAYFHGRENEWFYRITVRDNGCGMDEETLQQIYLPFFTTKKPGEGTGLGLAVVQRLVETHGGFIHAESTPGEGTTFTIWLPAQEETKEEEVESFR